MCFDAKIRKNMIEDFSGCSEGKKQIEKTKACGFVMLNEVKHLLLWFLCSAAK
jgi:hypothetical protein